MKKVFITLKSHINKRNTIFIIFTLLILKICVEALANLFQLDIHNEFCSHVFLIPFVSGYLIYKKRESIFFQPEYSCVVGIVIVTVGISLLLFRRNMNESLGINDYVALTVSSALILWIGGFILLYGINAFRAAAFPILSLFFMIPVPSLILDKIIYALNVGSAWVTYVLFKLTGISCLKQGFVFYCPGINILIDRQCSGIRSTMGILIPAVFSTYLFLYTGWRRALFILAVFPITILKNGFRILVLSMIAVYSNPQNPALVFLHSHGGVLFAVPAVCFLGLILILLIKSEQKSQN